MNKEILNPLKELKGVSIDELDFKLDSNELVNTLVQKAPALIRDLNMQLLQEKQNLKASKRISELLKAQLLIFLNGDKEKSKNAEIRDAYCLQDVGFVESLNEIDRIEFKVTELEQEVWIYRTLESSLRAVTELRIQEMRAGA